MPASNKNDTQVMDVSKPGKSVPSATSKPIIVGHKPMVQDPMVTADTNAEAVAPAAEEVEVPVAVSPSASKKVISPITEEKAEPDLVPAATEDTTTESTDNVVTESEESAVVDAIIDQVGNKNDAPSTSNEDKQKYEHIEKLITDKKYFVPLGKVNGKKGHGFLFTAIVLFLIFIGLIAAMDAGVFDAGFDLPFDVIKS